MPEELTREIRKLEIRLKVLLEKDTGLVEMLRGSYQGLGL